MLPEYSSQKNRYYSNPSSLSSSMDMNMNQDLFVQKLNYMIHLLEEQQDEKTNNVTEEVVLYSFLGIFIIFIVDSFVRIGKYVR
jgi:high-affinity K+ transport system ATPase subunit B